MQPTESDIADLVGENASFQRREWQVDRVGWALMALTMVAGLLGLWGSGMVSDATATGGRLSVDYERFVRKLGESTLTARIPAGSAEQGLVRLAIDQQYLTGNEVESVIPEPDSVTARNGRFVYEFAVADDQALTVRFDLRPTVGAGIRTATIDSGSGARARFWQFIYP